MSKLSHRPATIRTAQAFVTSHHRHNKAPRGARYAIEAVFGGAVVGVCIVGRPVARMLDDGGTVEVLRCCVADDAPRNTASYLYGAARRVWQSWGGRKVVTYNLQSESGESLRGAGFVLVARVRAEPKGWGRTSRPRSVEAITAQRKNRWQIELPLEAA